MRKTQAERPSQQKRTLGNAYGSASIPRGYNCSVIRAREALYQSRDVRNTWVSDSVPHTEHETHTPSYKESHFGNQDSSEAHG